MIGKVLLLALVFVLVPTSAQAAEMPHEAAFGTVDGLGAKAYCLIERETGRILFAENENEMLPMASTTKIMTALLAIENCGMDEMVTAGENAYGVTGTSMYLQRGETLSMKRMLQGLMVRSGNDAAVAIAEHVAGSVDAFAERMNERAQELGIDAHFVTPNGLDAQGHAASALAMARLAAEALGHDEFREIVSTKKVQMPWQGSEYDRVLTNKNKLLSTYEGATGVKTGYTSKAGRCLVFSAQRDGMELVGAVLNCYTWFDSAEKLLDAGFAEYEMRTALEQGEAAGRVRVAGGTEEEAAVVAEGPLRAPLRQHEAYEIVYELPPAVRAPVAAGQEIGRAYLKIKGSGETLAECALIAQRDIGENSVRSALGRILGRWCAFGG